MVYKKDWFDGSGLKVKRSVLIRTDESSLCYRKQHNSTISIIYYRKHYEYRDNTFDKII